MKNVRITLWISIIVLVIASCGVYFGMHQKFPDPIALETESQPTIGYPKANVRIVAFLDPKCSDSKKYQNQIYPIIKEQYIDTNKALYTVIPVSFLPNSMPAAIALLCVYNQSQNAPNPELFMKFLDYIYKNEPEEHADWTSTEKLLEMAQNTSPAIRSAGLKNCINTEKYHDTIVENTNYEKKILGKVQAPVIFINGIRLEQVSEKNVDTLMKIELNKAGDSL